MKTFISKDSTYYVGTANDIKAIHKSILRAMREGRATMYSFFTDVTFNQFKIYGLKVVSGNYFAIYEGEDILYLLITGELR